jgi:hypothetical protein
MYYLVTVDHNGKAAFLIRSDRRVVRSTAYPVHWLRLIIICCGMTVKRIGMLGVSGGTLIGTGR